ncbi:radical SAM family heme chaperone HemW [Porcipelethomonas sp.]|uniref:radical SAM family heme chaperone HemW n=1 Tax=Porcipelethomonas sp. TaxID=2981675 RepID=UPI003EF49549
MNKIGIYIHVPFCGVKCPYCDFYSTSYNLKNAEKYTESVIRDIQNLPDLYADTVYFGGGTPSLLPTDFIEQILWALKKNINLVCPEITIEINPCTVNKQKLEKYHDMGINRLSFGVQSAIDSELKLLGRKHTFESSSEIINTACKIGFKNISCDLMIGLPGQTAENLLYSIDKLAGLPIQHISSYILKIEENTPFNCSGIINKMPDDDYVSDLYLIMVKELQNYGFFQYEISNFSRSGFESKHNLKYWKCMEYVGIGPAAHSYYDNKRFFITPDLNKYINSPEPEITVTDYNPGQTDERIMLGLRLTDGINVNDFPDLKAKLIKKACLLESNGLVKIDNDIISLTPEGFLLSNSIINEFI